MGGSINSEICGIKSHIKIYRTTHIELLLSAKALAQ